MAFTFFFRDEHTLRALVEHFVPYVAGRSRVRIWDAGCALGQEPYTLAILLAERMGPFAFKNLRIDATDSDPTGQFQPVVENAVYTADELARVDRRILAARFVPSGDNLVRVAPSITERVRFCRHDLLSLQPVGEGYSAVVCKNVLLHFEAAERVAVIRMFHRALAPGGLLALEQTQDLPTDLRPLFEQVTPDARVFRRLEAA